MFGIFNCCPKLQSVTPFSSSEQVDEISEQMAKVTLEESMPADPLKGRITLLENEAGVTNGSRVPGMNDEEYLEYLEDLFEEEGTVRNGTVTLFQFGNDLIEGDKRRLPKNYGQPIWSHQGLSITSDPQGPSNVNQREFVSKTESASRAKNECVRYKAFWDQLDESEKREVLPFVGAVFENGEYKQHFTYKLTKDLDTGTFTLEEKNSIAQSLIHSFKIFLKYKFIIVDIKPHNVLYIRQTQKALFCDFESLIDFKNLLKEPSETTYASLLDDISKWSPEHLPFEEFQEVYRSVQNQEDLNKIYIDLIQICKYSLGSVLYRLYTRRTPCPLRVAPEVAFLSALYTTQYIRTSPPTDPYLLGVKGCPEPLIQTIMKLLSRNKEERTLDE